MLILVFLGFFVCVFSVFFFLCIFFLSVLLGFFPLSCSGFFFMCIFFLSVLLGFFPLSCSGFFFSPWRGRLCSAFIEPAAASVVVTELFN